jgi:hypothetical protein
VSAADLAGIKNLRTLSTSASTSFVAVDAVAIEDMAGNAVVSIPASDALGVSPYSAGFINRYAISFEVNLSTGCLLRKCSHHVVRDIVVPTPIALQTHSSQPLLILPCAAELCPPLATSNSAARFSLP